MLWIGNPFAMAFTPKTRAVLLLLLSLNILTGCSRERVKSVYGRVVKVADGDTITILDSQNVKHRIRLKGIDAPERKQDFSDVSRENLARLVFGHYVRIEYEKVDRYGRLVGKVWVNSNDECLEQLKAGLAWHFKKYEKEQSSADQQLYAKAEQDARAQKIGLWKDAVPTPPWDVRHHATGSFEETDQPDQDVSSNRGLISATPTLDQSSMTAPTPVIKHSENASEPGPIRGNKNTKVYHWPGCPNYEDISPHNRILFSNRQEAERLGYRAARNCS